MKARSLIFIIIGCIVSIQTTQPKHAKHAKGKPHLSQQMIKKINKYFFGTAKVAHGKTAKIEKFVMQDFMKAFNIGWNAFKVSSHLIDRDFKTHLSASITKGTVTLERSTATGGPMIHLKGTIKLKAGAKFFNKKESIDYELFIEPTPLFPFIGVIFAFKASADTKLKFKDIHPGYHLLDTVLDIKGTATIMLSTWEKNWGTIAGPRGKHSRKDYSVNGPDGQGTTQQGFTLTASMKFKGNMDKLMKFLKQSVTATMSFNVGGVLGPNLFNANISRQTSYKPSINPFKKLMKKASKWSAGISGSSISLGFQEPDPATGGNLNKMGLNLSTSLGLNIRPPGVHKPYSMQGSTSMAVSDVGVPLINWSMGLSLVKAQKKRSWKPFNGPVALHNIVGELSFSELVIPTGIGLGGNISIGKKEIKFYTNITATQPLGNLLIAQLSKKTHIYFSDLLFMWQAMGIPAQAIRGITPIWAKVKDVYFDNLELYISQSIGQIGGAAFKSGFLMKGNMHMMGNIFKAKMGIDDRGFIGIAKTTKPLTLQGNRLIISDAKNLKKGPSIDFQVRVFKIIRTKAERPDSFFKMTGRLRSPKIFDTTGTAHLDKNGFEFKSTTNLLTTKTKLKLTIPIFSSKQPQVEADLSEGLATPFNTYITKTALPKLKKANSEVVQTCKKAKIPGNCEVPECKIVEPSCKELCDHFCPKHAPFPLNKACPQTCKNICQLAKKEVNKTVQTWVCGGPKKCQKWKEYAEKKVCDAAKVGCKTWNKTVEQACANVLTTDIKHLQDIQLKTVHYKGTLLDLHDGVLSRVDATLVKNKKPQKVSVKNFPLNDLPSAFALLIIDMLTPQGKKVL